ncbi:Eukaryotic translation initiation factor 4B [Batrachochytrium dendrobatidis]
MSKKSQKKGQTMDLSTFLSNEEYGDWADDVQDLPSAPAVATGSNGNEYPSRGYESREDRYGNSRPELPIPTKPPFTVNMGNLSYDVSERDISMFFGDEIRIKSIRLPMGENGQSRGFGYVELEDHQSIVAALKMSGEQFMNRPVRIRVVEDGKRSTAIEEEKFGNNWRTSMRAAEPVSQSYGFSGDRGRNNDGRSSYGRSTQDSDFSSRVASTGWRSSTTAPAPLPTGSSMNRRKFEPSRTASDSGDTATKELPSAPKKPSANPFGAAKPRDEAEIQRQLEERRKAREEEEAAEKKAAEEEKLKQEAQAREKADAARKIEQDRAAKESETRKATAEKKKIDVAAELPTNWRKKTDTTISPATEFKAKTKTSMGEHKTRHQGSSVDTTAESSSLPIKKSEGRSGRPHSGASASRGPIQQEKSAPLSVKNVFDVLGDQDD